MGRNPKSESNGRRVDITGVAVAPIASGVSKITMRITSHVETLYLIHSSFSNKMPGADHGLNRGISIVIETVIVALLIGTLVPAFVEAGLLPRGFFWWIIPASIISAVMTIDDSRYWSYGYLAGVVIGIFIALPIFLKAGLLGPFDLLIYGGLAVGAIALRVKIHSSAF